MASSTKPVKGILKNSTSFETSDHAEKSEHKRDMKWDEMNILATYHPEGKDYGHMKVDEPPTPYNNEKYTDDEDELDPVALAARLETASKPKVAHSDTASSDEDEQITDAEKVKRRQFEKKRKMHYNEFMAVKLARQLIDKEDEEDPEEDEEKAEKSVENAPEAESL